MAFRLSALKIIYFLDLSVPLGRPDSGYVRKVAENRRGIFWQLTEDGIKRVAGAETGKGSGTETGNGTGNGNGIGTGTVEVSR